MFGITVSDQITITAVYAAIISTGLLILKIFENLRTVKVRLNLGHIIHEEYNEDNPFQVDYLLDLHCVNKGKRQIQIDKIGIKIGTKLIHPYDEIMSGFSPKLLRDGEAITIPFNVEKLAEGLSKVEDYKNIKKIQGFVVNGFGKRYYSKKIDFDVEFLYRHYKARKSVLCNTTVGN